MKAIQSATITPALILNMENEIGQVKSGFFADIIATSDDPTENIKTMENVIFVMKEGKIFKQ
jgi:imidazolonepropionase-like amidohydrolase